MAFQKLKLIITAYGIPHPRTAIIATVLTLITLVPMTASAFMLSFFLKGAENFPQLNNNSYAVFNKVEFNPPSSGKPCQVVADVQLKSATDTQVTTSIASAELIFSVDGGIPKTISMKSQIDGRWAADIPGLAKGKKVDFYIRIVDSNGNATTGAMPSPAYLLPVPVGDSNPHAKPPDCVDITDFAAGYDDQYLYVRYKMRSDFPDASQKSQYFYGVRITNPETYRELTDFSDLYTNSIIWIYIPIAKGYMPNESFKKEMDLAIKNNDATKLKILKMAEHSYKTGMAVIGSAYEASATMNEAYPEGSSEGNVFNGKLKLSQVGVKDADTIKLILLTFENDPNEDDGDDTTRAILHDSSNYMILYRSYYSYTVK